MGWRFNKSLRIGKAFRINLSKGGVGWSAGIPGTGLRFVQPPGRVGKSTDRRPNALTGCLSKLALGVLLVFLGVFGLALLVSFVPRPDDHRADVVDSSAFAHPSAPSPSVIVKVAPVQATGTSTTVPEVPLSDKFDRSSEKSRPQPSEGKTGPVPSPDPRAASVLNIGKNHEKDRRTKAAVRSYSEVANAFPGTTEAAEALKRIDALGEKLIAGVMPSNIFTPRSDPSRRHKRNLDFSEVDDAMRSMGAAALSGGGGARGSFSSMCGAPTKAGPPCRNPVSGGGYCYLHR